MPWLFWLAVLVKARSFSVPSNKQFAGGMSKHSSRLRGKAPRYKLPFAQVLTAATVGQRFLGGQLFGGLNASNLVWWKLGRRDTVMVL